MAGFFGLRILKNFIRTLLKAFTRRKPIEKVEKTKLNKCLGTADLTALGVGSTLGVGIYVIIGTVAYKQAGPSVVLSFIIAAICSIFAGLCYAEFGALVPKAGSAYVYSYICVGELMAFIIGWNLILEYIIGSASVARSYSNYLDGLLDNRIENFLKEYLQLPESEWFSSYPDLFAFSVVMVLAIMLCFGVKESTQFNKIFTIVNFLVIIYCVIVGSFKLDWHNWNIRPDEIPAKVPGGKGGFFPFGFNGTISGAATCFYSYIGFDAIATTGEEVLNPQRSLPISIILSLLLVTLAYCAVSAVQTLMWPYYDQNDKAPLPYVFGKVGYPIAQKVITIGALAGLSTSLIGAMFPMPRVIYAMAEDCLVFKFLSNISPRFKTPTIATLLSGFMAGLMAMFFNVDELAEMMSIGTLLAYTLVAISVLILRYKHEKRKNDSVDVSVTDDFPINNHTSLDGLNQERISFWSKVLNLNNLSIPNRSSSRISLTLIALTSIFIFTMNVLLFAYETELYRLKIPTYVMILLITNLVLIILTAVCLSRQPKIDFGNSFKVPMVPYIPFFSAFANTYLMVHLNVLTWYRFIIWMVLGFLIYFSYGLVKSVGYLTQEEKDRLTLDADPVAESNHDTIGPIEIPDDRSLPGDDRRITIKTKI